MDNDGAEPSATDQVDHLKYVRLRAPQRDGQTLDLPADEQVDRLLKDNLALRESSRPPRASIASTFPLSKLRSLARVESIKLAVDWSNQYLPAQERVDGNSIDPSAPIVFGGHQPTLFHPGVWYKNFRLHQIAHASGATAINMVVDNDLSGSASVKFPQKINNRVSIGLAPFDAPGPAIPFEMQHIVDRKVFESFGERAADLVNHFVSDPIVEHLWPEVVKAEHVFAQSNWTATVAHAIAAGRHIMEQSRGLKTLEVPISRLARSSSFAKFSGYLIQHLKDFRDVYNQTIVRYRAKNGIRSSAHPVPELNRMEEDGKEWLEAPLWIWTDQSPNRRPLFVCRTGEDIEISDADAMLTKFAISDWPDWLVEQNQQIQSTGKGIFIRPRALLTTMYARLLASDLFVHGIGGAKYDQLTDQIIEDFFGVTPPGYVTATGTWRLPTDFPDVSPADITTRKERLRKMRFHPETFITSTDAETGRLIESKRSAIAIESGQTPRERHNAIESANLELQQLLEHQRTTIADEIDTLAGQVRDSQILNSREFSFCLHPIELIDRLI